MYRQSVGTGTTLRRQSPTAHEPERIKCHASFRSQFRGPWRPRPCGQLPPRHRIAAQSSMIDITAPADIIAGLPPKQTGPAAWLGPEVSQSREWIIELSGSDVAEVEAATAHFLSQPGEPTSRLAHVTPEEFPLPTLAPRLKVSWPCKPVPQGTHTHTPCLAAWPRKPTASPDRAFGLPCTSLGPAKGVDPRSRLCAAPPPARGADEPPAGACTVQHGIHDASTAAA